MKTYPLQVVWEPYEEIQAQQLADEPHTNYNFRAYLSWYLGATRAKLKGQWTEADYGDIQSLDDEDTSYDLATRSGTLVEAAPILDRVVCIKTINVLIRVVVAAFTYLI